MCIQEKKNSKTIYDSVTSIVYSHPMAIMYLQIAITKGKGGYSILRNGLERK